MSVAQLLREMAEKHSPAQEEQNSSLAKALSSSENEGPVDKSSGILVSLLTDPQQQYQSADLVSKKTPEKLQENTIDEKTEQPSEGRSPGSSNNSWNSASVLLQLLKEPRQISPGYPNTKTTPEYPQSIPEAEAHSPENIKIKEEILTPEKEYDNSAVEASEGPDFDDSDAEALKNVSIKEEPENIDHVSPHESSDQTSEPTHNDGMDPIVIQPLHSALQGPPQSGGQGEPPEKNTSTVFYSTCSNCHQGFWDMKKYMSHVLVCPKPVATESATSSAATSTSTVSTKPRNSFIVAALTGLSPHLSQQVTLVKDSNFVRRSSRKRTLVKSYKDDDVEQEAPSGKMACVEQGQEGRSTHSHTLQALARKLISKTAEVKSVESEPQAEAEDSEEEEEIEEQDSVTLEEVVTLRCSACSLNFTCREDARRHLRQEHNILSFINPSPARVLSGSEPHASRRNNCGPSTEVSENKSSTVSKGPEKTMSCLVCGRPRYTNVSFLDIFKQRPLSSRFYSLAKRLSNMLECKLEKSSCISKYVCVQCMDKVETLEKATMDRNHLIRRMKRTNLVKITGKFIRKRKKVNTSKVNTVPGGNDQESICPIQVTLTEEDVLQSYPIQLLVPEGLQYSAPPKISVVTSVPVQVNMEVAAVSGPSNHNEVDRNKESSEGCTKSKLEPVHGRNDEDLHGVLGRVVGHILRSSEDSSPSHQYTQLRNALNTQPSAVPVTSDGKMMDGKDAGTDDSNLSESTSDDVDNSSGSPADYGDTEWHPAGSQQKLAALSGQGQRSSSRPLRLAAMKNRNIQMASEESLMSEKKLAKQKKPSESLSEELEKPSNVSGENGVSDGKSRMTSDVNSFGESNQVIVGDVDAGISNTLNAMFPMDEQLYSSMQIDGDSLQTEYSCTFCNATFYTEPAIKTHIRCHLPGTKELHCFLCGYHNGHLPSQWRIMKRHLETEHGMSEQIFRRFPCPIKGCQDLFRCHKDLEAHVVKFHRNPFRLPREHTLSANGLFDFPCRMCGTSLQSKEALNIHIKCHSEKTKSYQCFMCGYQHPSQPGSWRIMRGHLSKEHTPIDIEQSVFNYFECPYYACRYKFSSQRAQQVHRACHDETRDGEFFCFQCRFTAPDTPFLWEPIKEHIIERHPEAVSDTFQCTCTEQFSSFAEIVEHFEEEEMSG